jgi:hypothetical protein
MPRLLRQLAPAAVVLVAACATVPSGPGILVLPGSTKSFEAFRADDAVCRQFAQGQIGGTTPSQAATNAGVGGAVVGTAVGAAAGAAIAGSSGAGVGAGVGLLTGTAVGAGYGYDSWWVLQQRYDNAYLQCMYANGNKVPVSRAFVQSPQQATAPRPTAPPPGYPPPPPPHPPPPPVR